MLGGLQHAVRDLDGAPVILVEKVRPRELPLDRRELGGAFQIGEGCRGELQLSARGIDALAVEHHPALRGRIARQRLPVAQWRPDLGRAGDTRHRIVVLGHQGRRLRRSLEEIRELGGLDGHEHGLVVQPHRLRMRAEPGGPFGGGPQRDPRLRSQGVGLRALGGVLVRGEVVAGERAGELVRAERFEEARGREVAIPPIATRQRVVGDLADQRLDERVLASLR